MTTITAEQAKAFLDGATKGPWKAHGALGINGILCYKNVMAEGSMAVAYVWHSDDYGPLPDLGRREANARLIAAAPDAMETIIAQADRITELEAAVKAVQCASKSLRAVDQEIIRNLQAPAQEELIATLTLDSERGANEWLTNELDAANAEIARLKAQLEDKEYRE